MACTSCASDKAGTLNDPKWRRALWIALAINGGMFAVEIVAGITGGSKALQADALDFFGDAANYAISLGVAGMAIAWRARAAMLKGATLALLGFYVLLAAGWGAFHGTVPHAEVMGVVGVAALVANGLVAVMLYRFRTGDANMRSVWICSRNDAIGNIAVVLAAAGVFGTGTAWPDLIVAGLMATLGLWGGFQIIGQARTELRSIGKRHDRSATMSLHPNR
ncbi:cation transporter [Sphingomonas sp. 179-I 2A4 NHS]|uniref:cation transporter n=1 Tax=unclassified Sphingomonas TaxID=196159 RepID=UPI0006F305E8|nr:cation transporter [Sphingomonas sp. Leaf10]KQM37879.1 cation transporter [Sphingomonas sp. Leaf10]